MWFLLSCVVVHQIAMHVWDHSLLTVTALILTQPRRTVLGSSGVNWSVVEVQAPRTLLLMFAVCTHQRMTVMHVWGCSSPVGPLIDSLNHKRNVSDSRAVVWYMYVERSYTCSFQVMRVCMHKMAHQKETVMRVWSHNSPIVAHMQL